MASVENAEIAGIVSMITNSSRQVVSTDNVSCDEKGCYDTGDCQYSGDDEEN